MKTKKFNTSQLTILGLMSGILFLMAYTPLGYLNVGPLAVTFNVIPVAICAIVLGPTGGAVAGAVFGLTSYMQAMGIGGVSALGSALFQISPVLTAIQCFVPRILDGICLGLIYRVVHKKANTYVSCAVFYECTCYDVWKYRTDPESYGWKKYHRRMLRDGWVQCNQ